MGMAVVEIGEVGAPFIGADRQYGRRCGKRNGCWRGVPLMHLVLYGEQRGQPVSRRGGDGQCRYGRGRGGGMARRRRPEVHDVVMHRPAAVHYFTQSKKMIVCNCAELGLKGQMGYGFNEACVKKFPRKQVRAAWNV
jgi:hypothetical protein